ncbi:hypothetical protein PNEG_04261 [Pneumocystis murina B123]|uniref:Major facilitator superfamily (MFS) profile domain-containing protein n=1 Tax=Pneumocystis murina (strain B123) TaxID=1069680 RepID=A0A0W4ZX40_PNEMU|nr:hypothetical protein PNEG_04261 [Pneumocystis murina B123]KTW32939.1 hypothetical protein PNEG_04261 [Pneumocystis murina B123]
MSVFDIHMCIDTLVAEINEERQNSVTEIDARTIKHIYRRLDFCMIPCLWLLYFFAFSAKSIISVSLTMNFSQGDSLQQLINLSSREVSIGLSLFYIGYVVFEVPSNLIIIYITPRFWLSETVIFIGITCILHIYITNSSGFYIFRFLLGMIEAGIWPGMAYYLTLYYPSHMIQKRILWYFTAAQISTMSVGFFSIGLQKMNGIANLQGYKWMFLIYGIFSIIAGIITIWLLPPLLTETPITKEELQSSSPIIYGSVIIQSIDSNISDLKISLLYGIIWIANLTGAIAIINISNYYKSRIISFIFCCITVIIGMLILTFSSNTWIQYIGLLTSAFGIGPSVPICMAWCAHIFTSQSNINIAASSALLSGLGNMGSIFTTYTLYKGMRGKDAFKKSNLVICAMMCTSILACLAEKMLLKYCEKSSKRSHAKIHSIVNQ